MGWPGPCARGSGRAGSSLLKSWTWLARRSRRANVASAKKGVEERTMCFLLAGTRGLLLVPRYNIQMQLDSRQARPRRWLQSVAADSHRLEAAPSAWALCSGAGAHGRRRPDPAPRAGVAQTRRRQPRARQLAGGRGLFSKTLSLARVNFLF